MATKLKPVETVADVLTKHDEQKADNLRLWNVLGRTDPSATKPITGKRFGGTAIKPMWINKRLTETFGPAGKGWGAKDVRYELVHEQDGEVLVFCILNGWYLDGGERCEMVGVGGELAVKKERNGMFLDDEAYKKAYTDALNNAFKFVGAAADVHMGLFDDSKYVAEVREEFHPSTGEAGPRKTKLDGPYDTVPKLEKAAKEFVRSLNSMGSLAEFEEWKTDKDVIAFVEQCRRDLPGWWFADHADCPPNFTPLAVQAANIRRGLAELEKESA